MDVADELMKTARKRSDGAKADPTKQDYTKKLADDRAQRIGVAAYAFNKYHTAYASDHSLTPEELVAAAYLENLNCREFYPEDLGGKKRYDEICRETFEWFEEHKPK